MRWYSEPGTARNVRLAGRVRPPTPGAPRIKGIVVKSRSSRPLAGFTIVELLVVIGVIGLLVALLVPALGSAQRRARKTDETASLRQIGIAWSFYATTHREAALPGYIPEEVQNVASDASTFALTVRFPDGSLVPPQLAATWPWRLAAQLDYNPRVLIGNRPLDEVDDIVRISSPDFIDPGLATADGAYAEETTRAETIAFQPAFGYNAYYVGGWYQRVAPDGGQGRPRARFSRVAPLRAGGVAGPMGSQSFIAQNTSHIRSSDLILFCTTTNMDFSTGGGRVIGRLPDDRPGSHLAVPRFVGTTEVWRKSLDSTRSSNMLLQALRATPDSDWCTIPIARHGSQVGTLRADLSIQLAEPGALDDQRLWINGATNPFQATHGD